MCQQCTTDALNYGEVIPGWYLMRAQKDGTTWKAGHWGLVWSNDPTFTWEETPTANPAFGLSDEDEEALYQANKDNEIGARIVSMSLPEDFSRAFGRMNPRTGYEIITAAMERGYDPKESGDLSWWLFDWIGEYLKTAEPKHHSEHDLAPDLGFAGIDGPVTLTAGTLLYGDLFEILSKMAIPAGYTSKPFALTLDEEIVGVAGRSVDQPSGWSCIVNADIASNTDASTVMIPDGQTASITVSTMAERSEPLPLPEHDRVTLRLNDQELLGLS